MLLSEEMDEILPAIVLATQLDGGRGRQRAVLPLTCGREAPRAHTSAEPRGVTTCARISPRSPRAVCQREQNADHASFSPFAAGEMMPPATGAIHAGGEVNLIRTGAT
jgi:hypothetical protein